MRPGEKHFENLHSVGTQFESVGPQLRVGRERVFSLLEHYFGAQRDNSLSDLIEGSLMLKYNNIKRSQE